MARPIVLSNGELHVGLNKYGLVHDFYFPYVGFENHAAGAKLRHKVGVWIDGVISWLDDPDQWQFTFHYPHTALIGHTLAKNEKLGVVLEFDDTVDTEMSLFMRNIHVVNLRDQPREIRLFMHQAFAIGDSRSNTDTAQYLPDSNAILHYRGRRAFVISGSQTGGEPFDQYSIGVFGIEGHEGSFRDADDGELSFNNVDHGRVDSVIRFKLTIAPHSSERVHYWIAAGMSIREALYVHKQMQETGLDARLHSTAKWWHEWLAPTLNTLDKVPAEYRQLFIQSVMIMKSQIDKRGAVMASTDSTQLNYSRDAYAYSWGRDGAYTIWPLIRLGYYDEAYRFFDFCKRGLHPSGYVMQKYRADGALGSSWHPYVHGDDVVAPPIQEDETALIVYVFTQFFELTKDGALIKDFYNSMIKPMADFLSEYVDEVSGLPKPSYDLWEQDFMTTTYTTSTTYGALLAASELAMVAGDQASSVKWRSAADDLQVAAHKHLFNESRQVFYHGVHVEDGHVVPHERLDTSSVFGVFMFNLFDRRGHEVEASVKTVKETFDVGQLAPALPRYEDDEYRRSDQAVTGNWWIITSLWLAQYSQATGDSELTHTILRWVRSQALSTGMLAEQVDPATNQIISPAPLTWSQAEYVSTILDMIEGGQP